jgi:hypothetical protein
VLNWWRNGELEAILDEERRADLRVVLQRIRNRKLVLHTGQVVAGLSFGFWVGILDGRYNPPIWGNQLRVAFPDFPAGRGRKSLHMAVMAVANGAGCRGRGFGALESSFPRQDALLPVGHHCGPGDFEPAMGGQWKASLSKSGMGNTSASASQIGHGVVVSLSIRESTCY